MPPDGLEVWVDGSDILTLERGDGAGQEEHRKDRYRFVALTFDFLF